MKKCKFDDHIDDYLFHRLSDEEKQKFEEHYFNCPHCFKKMEERDELISFIKNKGSMIFQDEYAKEEIRKAPLYDKIVSFLTPKQWAMAAVSAALLLFIIFTVIPNLKKTSPQFSLDEDTVRGEKIILAYPVTDINTVPSQLKWNKSAKEGVEYKISIYKKELLWTATTKEDTISLPEEVKKHMILGEKYSWQVKAFSREGILVAVSDKVQFKITKTE